jgi:hypothetical protein
MTKDEIHQKYDLIASTKEDIDYFYEQSEKAAQQLNEDNTKVLWEEIFDGDCTFIYKCNNFLLISDCGTEYLYKEKL